MKRNKSSPKENTTYRREASSHHGQENRENRQPGIPEKTKAGQPVRNDKKERTYGIPKQTGSRSEFSDDEQYDMAEANRIEKSRSRTDMDDWTNQLWIPIINVIVTIIVCVLFMNVYPRWGQVQTAPTIDNSRATKGLMIRDLRNDNKKYKRMLDDMSSKLMTLDKANRRVDNLNEEFGELGKSFKTMSESNTGMLEEMRKIDNNSDKLRENIERIEQVNTDISNTSIILQRVDNLNEKFGELEKSFKTMTESNTGMLEELRSKIDNNSDKLRENRERIEQVNTDISNTSIDLERLDNLNEKFGELEKSFKTMTESNTGMLEEIRRKIDNNSDELRENRERIEQVNTNISNTSIDLEGVDNLTEKIGELEKSFKTMTESNTGMLEELRRKIDNNSDKLKENRERIEPVNTAILNTRIDLERVDNLNEKFGELEEKVKTMTEINTGMLEEMRRKLENNSDKLSENKERIEQVNTDISNTRIDLEKMLRRQDNDVKKTIQESNTEVKKMNDKIKKIEEEINSTSETIKKAEEAKTLLQNEVKNIDEIVAFLKANDFNKSVMLNLVVFLTIAVFGLIIGMWIIWNRLSFDHHGNTPRHGSGTNPRMSVIEQVTKNPPLTNTICFISYGQTNESFNHKLVHKLMGQLSQPLQDTPVRGHLINSHADIANIPHCKLIFMCVEFSTRHVIIEEPCIGQGDIRRTTYDAVRKLGATLVILYTRDHDSRQLRDGLRYQSNIYCVASQSELKVLDDKNCFYSVFDSFTPFQVEQLKDVIRNALQ